MNKKALTEADIRTKFITPAIVGKDGRNNQRKTKRNDVFAVFYVNNQPVSIGIYLFAIGK